MSRSLLCTVAGALIVLLAASRPAAAQAPDAADRCTPDVMRLCSEFVPDPDSIVACLKKRRHELSASCLTALTSGRGGGGGGGEKIRKRRGHHES
jgi:hypothetical protein